MRLQWGCGRGRNLPVIGSVAGVGKAERGEWRGRVGVPLYVLYPAADPSSPIVLPELLTESILLETLKKLP